MRGRLRSTMVVLRIQRKLAVPSIIYMRPTDLSFRSPKERTPDSYCPQVTSDGRVLSFSPRQSRGCTIGHELRFKQYSVTSRKTGYCVGPGSYDLEAEHSAPCSLVYRPMTRENLRNRYMMVGNHMVSEDIWRAESRGWMRRTYDNPPIEARYMWTEHRSRTVRMQRKGRVELYKPHREEVLRRSMRMPIPSTREKRTKKGIKDKLLVLV